jgi:hypothetical protein
VRHVSNKFPIPKFSVTVLLITILQNILHVFFIDLLVTIPYKHFGINFNEEIDISATSITAIICKLAQVPPEIWMTLSMEAKKWLLNERKRKQQETNKMKKSSRKKDTIKDPEKDTNSSNMPNQ